MSVSNPRNRLVYFRISEDEFKRFSTLRELRGARSISDLARLAMQDLIDPRYHLDLGHVSNKLALLEMRISNLDEKVNELAVSLVRQTSPTDIAAGTCVPAAPNPMKQEE